jgi:hypothetical protein
MPISNTPLAQAFQALVGQAQAVGHGDGMRVPFQFSSTLREAGAANNLPNPMATTFYPQGTLPVVSTLVNPSSIQWTQAKRIQRQDVRNGTVFTHFMNTAGQDIDILELTLSGTTGNIDLREETFAAFATQPVAARRKLQVWHNLYALTREPRLIPPNIVNKQTIRMQTKLFPGTIRLSGFYSSVLQFTESADAPNSVDWTMNFTVQDTTPDLNEIMGATFKQLSSGEALQPQRDDTPAGGGTA